MKIYLFVAVMFWAIDGFGQKVGTDTLFIEGKCDSTSHELLWVAATYPPCYDCFCGKHLNFGMKTYMALEKKYGDSLDTVVRRFMKSGAYHRREPILDSATIENLAGAQYRKVQSGFHEMLRQSDSAQKARGEPGILEQINQSKDNKRRKNK